MAAHGRTGESLADYRRRRLKAKKTSPNKSRIARQEKRAALFPAKAA